MTGGMRGLKPCFQSKEGDTYNLLSSKHELVMVETDAIEKNKCHEILMRESETFFNCLKKADERKSWFWFTTGTGLVCMHLYVPIFPN